MKRIYASVLLASFCLQAQAGYCSESLLDKANDLYKKGDYARARQAFEMILKQRPGYWPAFYQIGNCDLKLHHLDRAQQAYSQCIAYEPPAEVAKQCNAALQYIKTHKLAAMRAHEKSEQADTAANNQDAEDEKIADSKPIDESPDEQRRRELAVKLVEQASDRFAKRRAAALEKKQKIIDDAVQEAKAVRERAKQSLDYYKQSCRNRETGEIIWTVPTVIEDDIMGGADAEAERIMRCAEIRANGIDIPAADGTAGGIESQLMDRSRGGIKLDHRGTSLFVRNYTRLHENRPIAKSDGAKEKAISKRPGGPSVHGIGTNGGALIGSKSEENKASQQNFANMDAR